MDQLQALGGSLAELSPATVELLDKALPQGWSRDNPVDRVHNRRVELTMERPAAEKKPAR